MVSLSNQTWQSRRRSHRRTALKDRTEVGELGYRRGSPRRAGLELRIAISDREGADNRGIYNAPVRSWTIPADRQDDDVAGTSIISR